jgi:hypothetical protein
MTTPLRVLQVATGNLGTEMVKRPLRGFAGRFKTSSSSPVDRKAYLNDERRQAHSGVSSSDRKRRLGDDQKDR